MDDYIRDCYTEIDNRHKYLKPNDQGRVHPCRQGGFSNWLKAGITPPLYPNYGLPCIRGWVWWEDGTQTYSESCLYCGRLPDKDEE